MEFSSLAGPTTGRSLVLFADGAAKPGMAAVQAAVGPSIAGGDGSRTEVFPTLGVAVIDAPPEQVMQAAGSDAIIAVEPERIVYALELLDAPHVTNGHAILPAAPPLGATETAPTPPFMPATAPTARSADYLRGYRDAVLHLTEDVAGAAGTGAAPLADVLALDETQATWGLQATKVVNCCRSGAKIRVAVLDTGFDLEHPDFDGRPVKSRSFVPGEAVQDGHGHGTHCIGTALGRKCPPTGRPRYGAAHGAEIYAGKVLSNAGSGSDTGILAGIEWAIANKCAVVSMSLGAPTQPGQPFSQIYERVALRAQAKGTLIVAAAGNDSSRPGLTRPVSHPANCPSIMAVAALDPKLDVASFSNRGINPDGGQIDIAGPGVNVFSSWPMTTRYRRLQGTSMATPHVAGIAALYAEADPAARGAALWRALVGGARRLPLAAQDVGAGLVQAP
jgi:subtilisin family serine protease